MTSETAARSAADGADVAATQARSAALSAGVRVDELHEVGALHEAAALYQTVWRTSTRAAPVSPDLMRALSHAGGYVAGAHDGGRLVAASLAFHSGSPDGGLHSHISAVLPDAQGRDVGRALKLHQRSWALARGLTTISWTYDPLLRRNAWFNITKLGAGVVGYLVNFYGVMDDAQNGGDESDRAVVVWSLEAAHVQAAADGARADVELDDLLRAGARVGLRAEDGVPVPVRLPARAPSVLVQLPEDLQRLRVADPALAGRWRQTSREVLEPLLAGAYAATGFTRSGWYVLEEVSE